MTTAKAEEIREERESFFHKSLEILLKNKLTLAGMVIVALIILLGILAPLISPWDPNLMNVAGRLQAPSIHHFFGTDEMGRDIFSRILYGARISITVGLSIVIIAAVIGVAIGSLSGWCGGRVDRIIMALTDMILSFPSMVLALALTAALGVGLFNTMLAVCIVRIPLYVRLMRGAGAVPEGGALCEGVKNLWCLSLLDRAPPHCAQLPFTPYGADDPGHWRRHPYCFLHELHRPWRPAAYAGMGRHDFHRPGLCH